MINTRSLSIDVDKPIYHPTINSVPYDTSGHFKGCSKHIDIRFFFLSDHISRGLVKVQRVDSKKIKLPIWNSTKTLTSFSEASAYFIWWSYHFIINITMKVISLLSSEANLYLLLIEIVMLCWYLFSSITLWNYYGGDM